MLNDPLIAVLRDPREGPRKRSLRGLHERPDVAVHRYAPDRTWDATGRVLLTVGAPVLAAGDGTAAMAPAGLVLLDCAWSRVGTLRRTLRGAVVERSLPPLRTAFPRVSRRGDDPMEGLASVEALFAAAALLWGPDPSLLDGYVYKDAFAALNGSFFRALGAPGLSPNAD